MSAHRDIQLIRGLDECHHCVFVGVWVVAVHIALDTSLSGLGAFGEFFDEVIGEELAAGSGLDGLQEQAGGCLCFFDSRSEFFGGREAALAVGAGVEVGVLLGGRVEGWCAHCSGAGLECVRPHISLSAIESLLTLLPPYFFVFSFFHISTMGVRLSFSFSFSISK